VENHVGVELGCPSDHPIEIQLNQTTQRSPANPFSLLARNLYIWQAMLERGQLRQFIKYKKIDRKKKAQSHVPSKGAK
jgi:hypothetical protein